MLFNNNINYNLYKAFIVVFECRNKTTASRILNVSQPAITQNINELEKQLGVKLFTPLPRGVAPTIEAASLYKLIVPSFANIERADKIIKNFNKDSIGEIKIGCQSHISNSLLLDYICDFSVRYPKVKLIINNMPKDVNLDLLGKHEIDILIGTSLNQTEYPEFKIVELKKYTNTLFASKDFSKKLCIDHVSKQKLEQFPLITQFTNFRPVKKFLDLLQNANVETEVASMELVYHMTAKGRGIGYCLEEFLDNQNNNELVKLSVDFELPTTSLSYAISKSEMSNALRVFIDGLEKFCNAP